MAIRRQHGTVTPIAQLAKLAGQSIQARREQQRRDEALARAQEMQFKEAMANKERTDRMELAMFNLEASKQQTMMARSWDMQRMVMDNQHELEMVHLKDRVQQSYEMRRKLQKQQEYDMLEDKLRKQMTDRVITPEKYQELLTIATMQIFGDTTIPISKPLSPQDEMIDRMLHPEKYPQTNVPGSMSGSTKAPPPVPPGNIRVKAPDGTIGDIPLDEWYKEKDTTYKNYIPTDLLFPTIQPSSEDILRSKYKEEIEKYWHPSARTFFTMSPVKLGLEYLKARRMLPPKTEEEKERERQKRIKESKVDWGYVMNKGFK